MLIMAVIIFFLTSPLLIAAELTPAVIVATDHFQQGLEQLKDSVARLTESNVQLAAKNESLKIQVSQLRLQLGKLESQGQVLQQGVDKLKENNVAKAKQIDEAKQSLQAINDGFDKIDAEIKRASEGINSKAKEEEAVSKQLEAAAKLVSAPPIVDMPTEQPGIDPRKEKLKLMKMIMESKQRQAGLQTSVMDAHHASASSGLAQAVARKALLQESIKKLEQELSLMPKVAVVEIEDGGSNEDQFKQMDAELKALQKNHNELEGLVVQLQKKAALSHAAPNERMEQQKLELNINELKREGRALKADLEGVRVQMVELDKRKTRLESMLR